MIIRKEGRGCLMMKEESLPRLPKSLTEQVKPEPDFGPVRPEAGNDQNWQEPRKLKLTRWREEQERFSVPSSERCYC